MDEERTETPAIEDIALQMQAALMSSEPLPVTLLKEWLKSENMTYAVFAKGVKVNESTIKAWLNTRQGIAPKKESRVRNYIWQILYSKEGKAFRSIPETEARTYTIDDTLYKNLTQLGNKAYPSIPCLISNVLLEWVTHKIRNKGIRQMHEYLVNLSETIYKAVQIEQHIQSALQDEERIICEEEQKLNQLKGSKNRDSQCNELKNALMLEIEAKIKQTSENVEKLKELYELANRHRQLLIDEQASRPLQTLLEMQLREALLASNPAPLRRKRTGLTE